MLDNLFRGIFDSELTNVIGILDFLFCIGCALVAGIIISLCCMYKTKYTKSFAVTVALLPAVVCVVIMLVNGNIGTGIAVAGAFSLIRFRSAPGSAKEICAVFLAMGAGLAAGMGYLAYSIVIALLLGGTSLLLSSFNLERRRKTDKYKTLRITIPEDLNYTDVFVDIFNEYTSEYELIKVKTVNLGSMFRLTYDLTLNDISKEKELIDKLRCRNGNLEITIAKQETNSDTL